MQTSGTSEKRYIDSLLEGGMTIDQVKQELQDLGWHSEYIRYVVDSYESGGLVAGARSIPQLAIRNLSGSFVVDGREVRVEMRMYRPAVALLGSFLSHDECTALVDFARPRLRQSMVVLGDGDAPEEGVNAYARTSEQASIKRGVSALADRIRDRVAGAFAWPVSQIESMQVVRYDVGADFTPHHDYFCPEAHATLIERGGQRVATVLLYLNAPSAGGVTAFPDIELEIYPQIGNALFFEYSSASTDSLTLHSGVSITEGEKWVATFFLRDRASNGSDGRKSANEF